MTKKQQILAEIERRIEAIANAPSDNGVMDSINGAKGHELMTLLSFLDALPDEPVTNCHDLTEAKEEYLRKARMTPGHEWMTRDIEDAFKAGAEWQKTKMMDDACEEDVQEVYRDDDGIHCCVSVGTDYKPGTTVYVITIPKEDEDE